MVIQTEEMAVLEAIPSESFVRCGVVGHASFDKITSTLVPVATQSLGDSEGAGIDEGEGRVHLRR